MTITEYYENLVDEILLIAEAISEHEYTDHRRVSLAKKVLYMALRTVPGKYWIPPLAPQDRHLGMAPGFLKAVALAQRVVESKSNNIKDFLIHKQI